MEEEITRPFYGIFLMMVRERHTERVLIDAEEFKHFFNDQMYFNCSEYYLTYNAKLSYLKEVEKRQKNEPKIREKLNGVQWFIDGVLVSKEVIEPLEFYQEPRRMSRPY